MKLRRRIIRNGLGHRICRFVRILIERLMRWMIAHRASDDQALIDVKTAQINVLVRASIQNTAVNGRVTVHSRANVNARMRMLIIFGVAMFANSVLYLQDGK